MAKMPILRGREVAKIFESLGWEKSRQSGSHIILIKTGSYVSLSIPDHKDVAAGTLRSLIKAAGVTNDDFLKLV